jgi:hypothetical protein
MQWREKLAIWRAALQDEIEASRVLCAGETDDFCAGRLIPARDVEKTSALRENVGNAVFIQN